LTKRQSLGSGRCNYFPLLAFRCDLGILWAGGSFEFG
jgi:hypothetical protein